MRWAHNAWLETTAAVNTYMQMIPVREQRQAQALLKEMIKRRRANHLWRIVVSTEALMDLKLGMQARLLEAWRFLNRSRKRQVLTSGFINRVIPGTVSVKEVVFFMWARRCELLQESEMEMAREPSDVGMDTSAAMPSRIPSGSARGLPPRKSLPSSRNRAAAAAAAGEDDKDVSRGRQSQRSSVSRPAASAASPDVELGRNVRASLTSSGGTIL